MLKLEFQPSFFRGFKKLSMALRLEAKEKMKLFAQDPDSPFLKTHKLKGRLAGRWSFSVNYRYRMVFIFMDKNTAPLLIIGDHQIYQ